MRMGAVGKSRLWWGQRILFAFAVCMLAFCAFIVADAWAFQNGERRKFEQALAERVANPEVQIIPAVSPGGMIGRIDIPRLKVSVFVIEGTGTKELRRAAGHIAGTALPGQPGNMGISAHRDTFFRPLRNIRMNEMITLTTMTGQYRYRVVSTRIVDPSDVSVLNSSTSQVLTLVTCYPFYFVGSAPDRFIVRAERIG